MWWFLLALGTVDLSNEFKVKDTDEGTIIRVKVNPDSDESCIKGFGGGYLKINLESSPHGGEANRELIELLCSSLDIDKSRLRILKGKKSRRKELYIKKDYEDILAGVERL